MVSIRSFLFITAMQMWNGCVDRVERISAFYRYIRSYFHEHRHTWYLYNEHSIPLSALQRQQGDHPDWMYSLEHHRLSPVDPTATTIRYRPSWLSATVCITHTSSTVEQSMDDTLSNLIIDAEKMPRISDLYRIWCIRTKNWFCSQDQVVFRVITEQGDEITVPLSDEPLPCTPLTSILSK